MLEKERRHMSTRTVNRWKLGGEVVDRTDLTTAGSQSKCVITCERSDGSQFKRHLFGQVAQDAASLDYGTFVVLKGTIYKGTYTPEGSDVERDALRYSVRELEVVDEQAAEVNSLEVAGPVVTSGPLTETDSGRPKCPLRLKVSNSEFGFNAYDQVAKAADDLTEGEAAKLALRFMFSEGAGGGWKTQFQVLEITPQSLDQQGESDRVGAESTEEPADGADSEASNGSGGGLRGRLGIGRRS
jgi:hypothetical protein